MTPPRVPTILRAAAAAAALGAAWNPPFAGDAPRLRVVAIDVSASVGTAPSNLDPAWTEGLSARDRVAVVAFGDRAEVVSSPAHPPAPGAFADWPVGRDASSIAAALRTAAGLRTAVPGDARLEIVLVTDGRATDRPADLTDAALELRRSGGADLRVVEVGTPAGPPAVRRLRGPGRAAAGEPLVLLAEGVAPAGGGTVELLHGAAVVESRTVPGGGFRTAFPRIAEGPSLQVWEARLAGSEAAPAVARVVVSVPGATAVLAGALRPEGAAALGGEVSFLGTGATGVPSGDDLAPFDLVVVDDLSEAVLGGDLLRALEAHAADGGGVLLCGGESSFAAGGWGGRPVDDLSPLRSVPPEDAGSFLYVALDASGSMAEDWPGGARGVRRESVLRAGAAELVRGAGAGTRLVLRRFRETLLPDGHVADGYDLAREGRDAALRAISDFGPPGGSTALLPPLAEALDLATRRGERRRGAVLLTDGRSSESEPDLRAAILRLADAGVALTLVLPGPADAGADAVLLRAAEGTHARIRAADSPRDLAGALLASEREVRSVEAFAGGAALDLAPGAGEVLGPAAIPSRALRRNRAFAAPGSRVLVRADDGLPLAALAERGAGAVAALAFRIGDPAWVEGGGAGLVRALASAARRRPVLDLRVERGPDGFLEARLGGRVAASRPVLAIARGAGGDETGRVTLVTAGAGVLRSDGPLDPRTETVTVVAERGESTSAGLDAPAPPEYQDPPRADLGALAEIARAAPGPAPPRVRWPLCGLAIALLAASAFKWRARPSR